MVPKVGNVLSLSMTRLVPPTLTGEALGGLRPLHDLRHLSAEDWIERHGSGTLRKNRRIGFAWHSQYLHERVAYEFGWGFELLPASRVTLGRPYTEGDCAAVTEAGWHIERYMTRHPFPEDSIQAAYLQVEEGDGTRREGVGIFLAETSAPWVGQGSCVFAIIAPFVPGQGFLPAENPF